VVAPALSVRRMCTSFEPLLITRATSCPATVVRLVGVSPTATVRMDSWVESMTATLSRRRLAT
jgi:hypothetical protein